MTKKKVLHIINLGMNGKAVFLCNVLEQTNLSKYDIAILNFFGKTDTPIAKRLEGLPIRIVVNRCKHGFIAFLSELKQLLKTEQFDVVHSHMWDLMGIFLGYAKWYGVLARVAHSHNSQKIAGRYNPIKEFIRDKVVWNILKKAIELNANRYFACSNLAANWLYTSKVINNGGKNYK